LEFSFFFWGSEKPVGFISYSENILDEIPGLSLRSIDAEQFNQQS